MLCKLVWHSVVVELVAEFIIRIGKSYHKALGYSCFPVLDSHSARKVHGFSVIASRA